MKNPFDRNFFNFLAGFVLILAFSFAVLYFTGLYNDVLNKKTASVVSENQEEQKMIDENSDIK